MLQTKRSKKNFTYGKPDTAFFIYFIYLTYYLSPTQKAQGPRYRKDRVLTIDVKIKYTNITAMNILSNIYLYNLVHICKCNHWSLLVGNKYHFCSHDVDKVKFEDKALQPLALFRKTFQRNHADICRCNR